MTKLQKRVYLLIMRCLIILLYYRMHQPDPEMSSEGTALRKDLQDEINNLRKGI